LPSQEAVLISAHRPSNERSGTVCGIEARGAFSAREVVQLNKLRVFYMGWIIWALLFGNRAVCYTLMLHETLNFGGFALNQLESSFGFRFA